MRVSFDCGTVIQMAASIEQELIHALEDELRTWGMIADSNDVEKYVYIINANFIDPCPMFYDCMITVKCIYKKYHVRVVFNRGVKLRSK